MEAKENIIFMKKRIISTNNNINEAPRIGWTHRKKGEYMRSDKVTRSENKDTSENDINGVSDVISIRTEKFQ